MKIAHKRPKYLVGSQMPDGAIVLAQSEMFRGDEATRPYVIRLVYLDRANTQKFIVWVYLTDREWEGEEVDKAHGEYCSSLWGAINAYKAKCLRWNVSGNY